MTAAPSDRQSALLRKYLARGCVYCRHCGYPLCGLVEFRCPECGHAITLVDVVHCQGRLKRAVPGLVLLGGATAAWVAVALWVTRREPFAVVVMLVPALHVVGPFALSVYAWAPPRTIRDMERVRWAGFILGGLSLFLLGAIVVTALA